MSMEGKMSWTVSDAVNYKGFPADKSKTGGWIPAALILGVEMSERLSTMGIAVNLVTYLTGTMHLPSSSSANIVTDFMGTCFLLCLLGGFLADSFLGRFKTILVFAAIQILGTATLAMSTAVRSLQPGECTEHGCPAASGVQMAVLYGALYLIALGTGGLKSSVSGFGTDQFDESDPAEKAQMGFFFQRFFLLISLGTLLAVTVLVYVQDEIGRTWAYGLCSASMAAALLLLLCGLRRFRFKPTSGSPVAHLCQVAAAAWAKRRLPAHHHQTQAQAHHHQETQAHHRQFAFLDKACVVGPGDEEGPGRNPWRLCTAEQVEEVKMMIRLLPIWGTTILFWTTYAQMITFSVEQASTMDRSVGSFRIPAASLTVFFVAAIIVTILLYDRLIMPLTGNQGFTNLQRIGIGLVLSTLGMAAAAATEMKRLSVAKSRAETTVAMSVFVLIPQFTLVGAGEAFIYTGQLDLFITQAPKAMKTMSTGLFLTTLSLGFFVSSFLVSLVKAITGQAWLADHINQGRLDCFYALLTLLGLLNFLAYLLCARWFRANSQTTHDDKC